MVVRNELLLAGCKLGEPTTGRCVLARLPLRFQMYRIHFSLSQSYQAVYSHSIHMNGILLQYPLLSQLPSLILRRYRSIHVLYRQLFSLNVSRFHRMCTMRWFGRLASLLLLNVVAAACWTQVG